MQPRTCDWQQRQLGLYAAAVFHPTGLPDFLSMSMSMEKGVKTR